MRRYFSNVATTALLMALSSAASAQTDPSAPATSGGTTAQSNIPQPPSTTPAATTTPADPTYWFSDPAVRRELGLTPEQYNRLAQSYRQSQVRYNESLNGLDRDRSMTSEERASQIDRLRSTYNNNVTGTSDTVFTDLNQRNRYNQLMLQQMGYGAFEQTPVREQLKLSDEQMLRMSQYGRNWETQMGRLRAQYQTDPDGAGRRYAAARAEAMQQMHGVMTPEQRTQWQQLSGTPYNFTPNAYLSGDGLYGGGIAADGTGIGVGVGLGVGVDASGNPIAPAAKINSTPLNSNTSSTRSSAYRGLFPGNSTQPGANTANPVQPGRNPAGPVQPGRNPATPVQPGANPAAPVQPGANPAAPVQPGANPAVPVQPGANPAGPVQPGAIPTGGVQPGVSPTGPVQPGAAPGGALGAGGASAAGGAGAAGGTGK